MAFQIIRYGVGLDISKDDFHACISSIDVDGKIKVNASRKFKNIPSGFNSLIDWISKNRKQKDLPLRILMEATGVYHEHVLYHLHDLKFEVALIPGKRVKSYLDASGYKSKNDKVDGKGIAEMAVQNFGEKWIPISANIVEIRTVLRYRKSLITSKTRYSNQLHAMKHSKHKVTKVMNSLKQLIKKLDTEVDRAEKLATELAKKDSEMMEKMNMIIDSVKGLGLITVLTTVAETNGFHDFTSSKQLVSYSGYDIIENQSGKHVGKTRMSKKGNVHLRANVYMASVGVISSKIDPFYGLYIRLLARNGGIKKKAMVAVQRKLLVIIYTLWKKNESFDVDYYKTRLTENKKARA